MMKSTPGSRPRPICGSDLERWRIENGLSKATAADAFGLRTVAWDAFVAPESAALPVDDPVIAMLFHVYVAHPDAAPVREAPSIAEFYAWLGFGDDVQDRLDFAALIGRSVPTVYRHLLHNGRAGRPVIRWMEALRRLGLSPRATKNLMEQTVQEIAERQGVPGVLKRGWTADGRSAAGDS
jgi:hypothetical protein